MRRLHRKALAAVVGAGMLIGMTGVAGADNVHVIADSVSPDRVVNATVDIAEDVNFWIQATGTGGCDAADGSAATLRYTAALPAGVTVTPASLTFTACGLGNAKTFTFTSTSTGTKSIPQLAVTDSSGTYNAANSAFKLVVAAVVSDPCAGRSAPAAPTITETNTAASTGWYNAASPAAKFTVSPSSNAEYKIGSGSWTAYTGEVTFLDDGEHSVVARNFLPATTSPVCARIDGTQSSATVIKVDRTAPSATPASVSNTTWRNTSLSQEFTFTDFGSGLAPDQGLTDGKFTVTASAESADAETPTVSSTSVSDVAGNSTTRSVSAQIDLTRPSVGLVGGPADGASYYFGFLPTPPTCTASDALSGLADSCSISGGGTSVGRKTVTASATDNAGNSNSVSRTYTVLAWTANGFYNPVDTGTTNVVKGGSSVPLKFEVFAGTTELTNTSSTVSSFRVGIVPCDTFAGDPSDQIEQYSTGGTVLRYDEAGGQFIQNWQVPKGANVCYKVLLTLADGTPLSANFKTK